MEEATKAVRLETGGSRQNESPYKEELALLREGNDLRLECSLTRQAFKAGTTDDRAEFFSNDKLNAWSSAKL